MKNGTASSGVALTEPNRFWCSTTSGTCMKNTSATVTAVSSTMKIGKPSSSSTIGTTTSANVIPAPRRLRARMLVRAARMTVTRRQAAISKISAKPSATVPCGIHIGTPAMSLVRPIRNICAA